LNSWVVITTINPPRIRLFEFLNFGWKIVIVGDAKTSDIEWEGISNQSLHYLSFATQESLFPELSKLIGTNTYARKNIGYLYAASQGADIIFDTDDDTFPRDGFDSFLKNSSTSPRIKVEGEGFFNPYIEFAPNIGMWPRGYPLDLVSKNRWSQDLNLRLSESDNSTELEIVQTLVNLEPDLDSIYRMTISDEILDFPSEKEIFEIKKPVLSPGNTQSTLWLKKEKFEYLYIPISVSFRFCDIFKMYVAQRFCSFAYSGFWTEQIRNPHVYMKDFESEVECFLKVRDLTSCLAEIQENDLNLVYKSLSKSSLCCDLDAEIAYVFLNQMRNLIK
jgi:hypothetical protein